MSHKTIGEQIWEQAIAAANSCDGLLWTSTLRAEITAAINQLAEDFRADLDAIEKHYLRSNER